MPGSNIPVTDLVESPTAPRSHRSLRVASTSAAMVLVAGTFVWGLVSLRGLHSDSVMPRGSGGVARIPVPEPQPLAAGEGAIWVTAGTSSSQSLWRIDPGTDRAERVPG